ncbi:MAG: glucose-6-phosphate dehydrogenase assembly protein OpcA, partial [Gemmataceae bacterium]
GENREVTARVTVRPVSPNRGDVCVEMVTLHAGGDYVSRLPFAVRSLLLGDLPVNLWWNAPVPPPFAGPLVEDLSEQAQQIIYDSIGWPDPTMGMSAIATWSDQWENRPRRWRVSSDLNWRRLRIWRRLLTQSLDDASAPGANVAVQEILVEHGPHAVLQAWLLVSWLSRHLEWKVEAGKVHPGVEMSWNFQTPTGKARIIVRRNPEGPPEVHRLRVTTTINGLPACLCVEPSGPNRLCLRLEGLDAAARAITMTPHTAIELIGRQLSDRNRDLAFKESLDVAQVMAQSMLY